MDVSGNQLRAAGAASLRDMLKVNTTLTELNLSNNEVGGWYKHQTWVTPEGPTALAEGLAANSSVTQVNVASNRLGTEGGKALADCLKTNTTITQVRRLVARPCVAHAVLLHCAAALRCCAPPGGVSMDISQEKIVCQSSGSVVAASLIWAFVVVSCEVCVAGRCFCVHVDVRD